MKNTYSNYKKSYHRKYPLNYSHKSHKENNLKKYKKHSEIREPLNISETFTLRMIICVMIFVALCISQNVWKKDGRAEDVFMQMSKTTQVSQLTESFETSSMSEIQQLPKKIEVITNRLFKILDNDTQY